ncbi:hypothetical protein ABH930_001383 [Kitasatospora sp. GAS204A]|uniref:hypothetical protein n=1 Tax=unclassified Kitasatospora TaxID=2633591 RepID=UPI002474911F|nr:hypothetical protein [Kitasatospora sp. GAS204B]MDH6118383.1 hypothetical protein [Kitasatospora sp. GAS204B]
MSALHGRRAAAGRGPAPALSGPARLAARGRLHTFADNGFVTAVEPADQHWTCRLPSRLDRRSRPLLVPGPADG